MLLLWPSNRKLSMMPGQRWLHCKSPMKSCWLELRCYSNSWGRRKPISATDPTCCPPGCYLRPLVTRVAAEQGGGISRVRVDRTSAMFVLAEAPMRISAYEARQHSLCGLRQDGGAAFNHHTRHFTALEKALNVPVKFPNSLYVFMGTLLNNLQKF